MGSFGLSLMQSAIGLVVKGLMGKRSVALERRRARRVDPVALQIAAEEVLRELEQDDSIEEFKSTLEPVDVPELADALIVLLYSGDEEPGRDVTVRQILLGRGDIYLDCWWPARGDTRLFKGSRILRIVDAEGRAYQRVAEWLINSGEAGVRLADWLGWRGPRGKG